MADREKARIAERRYRANFVRKHGVSPVKAWYLRNPEFARSQRRKYWKNLRKEVIDAYGGKCKCCNEAIPEFLELDHINSDGSKERRELCSVEGKMIRPCQFYQYLKRNGFPGRDIKYRLLCSNCNQGRQRNHGICPHEELKLVSDAKLQK